MIKTTEMIVSELHDYGNPYGKIKRMVDTGELVPIVRGLYETDKTVSGYLLATFMPLPHPKKPCAINSIR